MQPIMTGIADAMPEDGFDYASTPEQRTFGAQILHVAGGNAPASAVQLQDVRDASSCLNSFAWLGSFSATVRPVQASGSPHRAR